MAQVIDWEKIGTELRQSAMDAHDGELPTVDIAYSFMADNPECFGYEDWPCELPAEAPLQLIVAYYAVGVERHVV